MATIDEKDIARIMLWDGYPPKFVTPEEIIPVLVEIQRRAESMTDFYERLLKKGYQIVKT